MEQKLPLLPKWWCIQYLVVSDQPRYAIASVFLLLLGLAITAAFVAVAAVDLNAGRLYLLEVDTSSCVHALNSIVYGTLTAVLAARSAVVSEHSGVYAGSSCVGGAASLIPFDPLHMLDDVLMYAGSMFAQVDIALGAFTVVSEANRSALEARYNARCRDYWGGLNLSLAPIEEAATVQQRGITRANLTTVPPSPMGMYLALSRVWRGDASPSLSCPVSLYDASAESNQVEAITVALTTGRIAWLKAAPTVDRPTMKNLGMVVPMIADDEASTGYAGGLHAQFVNRTTNSAARTALAAVCQPQGRTACGQAGKAFGAIIIPLFVESVLPAMEDVLGSVIGTRVTVVEITPFAGRLSGAVDPAQQLLRQFIADPASVELSAESAYVDARTSLFSSPVRKGAAADVLRSVQAADVVSANRLDAARTWRTGMDAAEALQDAIHFDSLFDGLQSTHVFLRGSRLYMLIVRHGARTTLNVDGARTVVASAFIGLLASLLLAAIPLAFRYMKQVESKRIAHALELVNAERDGVVQAVAFAAHEIRNPMHGVLASLDSAVADAAPLKQMLQAALGGDADGQDMVPMYSPSVPVRLQELLCGATCKAVLDALTDISVAKSSAENCHRLVNDMIDYSKLQKGAMALKLAPMTLRPSLRRVIAANKGFIPVQVATLLGMDPALPATVLTDEVRVLQVLTNSLTNAGKFCSEGSITVTACLLDTSGIPSLRLAHNPGHRWLVITTQDTGKGLGSLNVDSLFEPTSARVAASKAPASAAPRGPSSDCSSALSRSLAGRRSGKLSNRVKPEAAAVQAAVGGTGRSVRVGDRVESQQGGSQGSSFLHTTSSKTPVPVSAAAIAKSRGSGLGLPVARLMARALGGDIDLYSSKARGKDESSQKRVTCFLFLLPMTAVQPPNTGASMSAAAGSPAIPEQVPLFGRAGVLQQPARAALREAIAKRLQELEALHGGRGGGEVDGQGAGQWLETITSTRQAGPGGLAGRQSSKSPSHATTSGGGSRERPSSAHSTCANDPHVAAPSSASEQDAQLHNHSTALSVLYAEDDTTNRRLMERMIARLSKRHGSMVQGVGGSGGKSTEAQQGAQGPVQSEPAAVSVGPVQLVMAENGWAALCQLYTHGLMDMAALQRARVTALNTSARQATTAGSSPAAKGDDAAPLPSPLEERSLQPPFDLICCDNEMPLLDGMAVASLLRASQTGRAAIVPVVAVTGRCSGFTMLKSYLDASGLPLDAATLAALAPTMQVVTQLPDAELQASSFVGVLGKPYKAEDMAGLLALARAVKVARQEGSARIAV